MNRQSIINRPCMTIIFPHTSPIDPLPRSYLCVCITCMIMALNRFFFAASLLLFTVLLIIASASGETNTSAGKENLLSTIIAIQGLVYCKSGSKIIPLEGIIPIYTISLILHNIDTVYIP